MHALLIIYPRYGSSTLIQVCYYTTGMEDYSLDGFEGEDARPFSPGRAAVVGQEGEWNSEDEDDENPGRAC